jgi:hypothetical protein
VGFIRRWFTRPILDFAEGDFVRCAGWKGVWWIESFAESDQAWIAKSRDQRILALLVNLRHARPQAAAYLLDRKWK